MRRCRRDEHVQSLGAAGLHRSGESDIGQCLVEVRQRNALA